MSQPPTPPTFTPQPATPGVSLHWNVDPQPPTSEGLHVTVVGLVCVDCDNRYAHQYVVPPNGDGHRLPSCFDGRCPSCDSKRRLAAGLAAHNALPFWRRLFTRRPSGDR